MLNPPAPHNISNPVIAMTHAILDADAQNEAAAASFEYNLINGDCYYTQGRRIDIDSVMADTLKDSCVVAELEELFTNTRMVDLMRNVKTLRDYFQDHMDEATALLVRGAESGDLE
jgi:hypothetical protein